MAGFGIALGLVGVGGLVFGNVNLFKATRMSLDNIRGEAALSRQRQSLRSKGASKNAGILSKQSKKLTLAFAGSISVGGL
jgi:hypothetical protein